MINTKRTVKTLITLILIVTMASSIWIGTTSALMTGQSTVSSKSFITFEGTAANDGISSQQYSYQINAWARTNVIGPILPGSTSGPYASPLTQIGYNSSWTPDYALWGNGSSSAIGISVSGNGVTGAGSGGELNPGDVWFNAGKSLRIGMTEFGEFATQANTGMAYGANIAEWNNSESWASTAIQQSYMVNGWVLYLNYSRFYVPRCLEAYALYSNTASTTGAEQARAVYSWDGTYAFGSGTGTTLTGGKLVTGGIQVLYDSATLGVARETTTIWDGAYNEAVAQVTLTVIYDKTSKDVIVYYDVKMVLDPKILVAIYDFVFQKKYEIDLARNVNPSNAAYIHYFYNFSTSVYQDPLTGTYGYDVIQAYDPAHQYIFFDGIYPCSTEFSVQNPLVPTLTATPLAYQATSPLVIVTNTNTRILPHPTAIPDIVALPGEPNTPVVTIQWNYTQTAYPNLTDFLAKSPEREIRFVDVYGMTDYNKDPNPAVQASDPNPPIAADLGYNEVDTEVQWLLVQVFNPTDLTSIINNGGVAYNELYGGASNTPLWVSVGQGSAATDSAGAAAVSGMWGVPETPLGLFDINDTTHQGTIPYGLSPVSSANDGVSGYILTFSNSGIGVGNDPTSYLRLGLINFAFGTYDNSTSALTPQPVSGGLSAVYGTETPPDDYWWYPSINPLTYRWTWDSLGFDAGWTVGVSPNEDGWIPQYNDVNWSPNGIMNIGGEKANYVTRYFNDFGFAIDREGTSSTDYYGQVSGGVVMAGTAAPTNNPALTTVDFFPLSTWNTSSWNAITQLTIPVVSSGYGAGTAIISIAHDMNGTRGITVAGWNAQDTYWASAWFAQWVDFANGNGLPTWIPAGTVAIILKMTYPSPNGEPTFTIVQCLGTITQFGYNYFYAHYLALSNKFDPGIGALSNTQLLANPANQWNGYYALMNESPWFPASGAFGYPTYLSQQETTWWYAKLPTNSTATIQFDS